MKLDGSKNAQKIYEKLQERVEKLRKKDITPHLVVLLVGNHPSSVAYVTLKRKKAEEIGAKVTILNYKTDTTTEELEEKIKLLNIDPFVHGILIQRPLPDQINVKTLEMTVDPQKDIDGFHPHSPYTFPLALAVLHILEDAYSSRRKRTKGQTFKPWLESQNVVIFGKGPTGGGPVIAYLQKLDVKPHLIDSKTKSPEELTKQADIIISAVGKENIIKPEMLKKDVILIGVGINKGENKKLHGDYEVKVIKNVASYYTSTPGGVGPINVAMLLQNLVTAAEMQTKENNKTTPYS